MSVKYSKNCTVDESVTLLEEDNSPATVPIQPYIKVKKNTFKFDVVVLTLTGTILLIVLSLLVHYVYLLAIHSAEQKYHSPNTNTAKSSDNGGWMTSYQDIASESVIRLIDVDGDGADDIIFGMAQQEDSGETIVPQRAHCKLYKNGCFGIILAINGKSGSHIWNISTFSEVFELNCGNIDINKDGKSDCIGAGRKATFVAFDPRTGKELWQPQTGEEVYLDYGWNIYNPLILDDVTSDGVPEVLLAHGGDPGYPPEVKLRHPGRLILLNGASGQIIGNYTELPDGRETYNSPVLHSDKQGRKYVLIGSGGETVHGSLFIILMEDLIRLARGQSAVHQHSYTPSLKHVKNGFFQLSEGRKGVMVPVVLADITGDRILDIITTSFDGSIGAFDGANFTKLWIYQIPGAESYTTPGAGYFNPDNRLDFMMHWNFGVWPEYDKSMIIVHSGKDGQPLWTFNTTRFSMTSDLVLKTHQLQSDVFILRVQGREGEPLKSSNGVIHGIDPQRKLNGNNSPVKRKTISCGENLDNLASEVFIIDWQTRESPVRLFRRDVDVYKYEAKKQRPSRRDIFHRPSTHKCAVMEQSSRTTGAIGDTDGDGKLDLVMTFNAQGTLTDRNGDYVEEATSIDLVKIDMEKQQNTYPQISVKKGQLHTSNKNREELHFRPLDEQIWTGYMGRNSLSKYIDE